MKNILMTGATGFIGSHIAERLVQEGYKVIILKRSFSDIWRIKNFFHKLIVYDIDKITLEEIFKQNEIDVIIHLATFYKKFHAFGDIDDMLNTNINFPVKIIDLAIKYNVSLYINTGTYFEYDTSLLPIKEIYNKRPFNLYSATKIAFEEILKYYSFSSNLKIVNMIIYYPYGERDNEYRLIPTILKGVFSSRKICLSEGLQKFDLIYIKDVANSYLKVIEKQKVLDKFEYFNVGSGFLYSVREIVSLLEELLSIKMNVKWESASKDMQISYADISKARKILGWQPRYSLKQGLENTIKYYREKWRL